MEDRERDIQEDLEAVAVEHALNRSASQTEDKREYNSMHTSFHGA